MASRTFSYILLISSCIISICFSRTAGAHGSFYPHHVQDFGAIKERINELRGPVIITTSIFVIVLAITIVQRRVAREEREVA